MISNLKSPFRGFSFVELLVVALLLAMLSGVLFQVSRSFFSQFLKIENALTILSEVGIFYSKFGEDVLMANGDPNNYQNLFKLEEGNPASGSWKLSFLRVVSGESHQIEYVFDESAVVRTFQGKAQRFTFSGNVEFRVLQQEIFETDDEQGKRTWLNMEMVVKTTTLSNLVRGNEIRLCRNFFPTFFNRRLNSRWRDNSKSSISK